MNLHHSCLLCDRANLHDLTDFRVADLQKCAHCGFVFCKKIPSLAELQAHYGSYPRTDWISPITIKRYHELLDTFEKYRQTNRIIDVGCGEGHFLEIALQRGWEVYGTEFTEEAVRMGEKKGIRMQLGTLNPLNYKDIQFDILTSFEVIEHINNPLEEVHFFHQLLRKGGITYLTTPNFNSISRFLLREKWNVIEYPEHLSYYTPKTISYLFEKQGFKKLKIHTTGISMGRCQQGFSAQNQHDIYQSSFRESDEKLREQVEKKWYLQIAKKGINGLLTAFGKGGSLKAYFEKR